MNSYLLTLHKLLALLIRKESQLITIKDNREPLDTPTRTSFKSKKELFAFLLMQSKRLVACSLKMIENLYR